LKLKGEASGIVGRWWFSDRSTFAEDETCTSTISLHDAVQQALFLQQQSLLLSGELRVPLIALFSRMANMNCQGQCHSVSINMYPTNIGYV